MLIYTSVFLLSVFISSISQVILKRSAKREQQKGLQQYLNFLVIFAYGLFFISTFITMLALKYIPLSSAPILEASGFIFVAILSRIFLKETITRRRIIGICIILIGIFIASL